ncbi:hypothetical protein SAMN05660642_01348 [Geodermatophilus siccatus]|uniref:Replication region DNA-binding N-term n=1 Tax=Geodermatophilus siccatus TaxID=1137991 RepID=A0A1G9PUB0_9ACTN|nr:hypothetical protein [Geodermatophilus siccatus]SDM01827.1 hypothetical protein SAMN05660642_01348 [Geodermatophilus siccatus]
MQISRSAAEALASAHDRIFSGTANQNGKKTLAAWADEAGVSLSTVHRSGHLKAAFLAQAAEFSKAIEEPARAAAKDKVAELERKLRERNEQHNAAVESMNVMAQQIQVLALENQRLREALQRAKGDVLVPFRQPRSGRASKP